MFCLICIQKRGEKVKSGKKQMFNLMLLDQCSLTQQFQGQWTPPHPFDSWETHQEVNGNKQYISNGKLN